MGRPRKSPTGQFSRQYIYNLRSELNELLDRLDLDPLSEHAESWRMRIIELKTLLGEEIIPFRERARQQRLAKLQEEKTILASESADDALKEMESLINPKEGEPSE